MKDRTRIEFYNRDNPKYEAIVVSNAVPREGEYINIKEKTWYVVRVTWAVDYSGDVLRTSLRANVIMQPEELL